MTDILDRLQQAMHEESAFHAPRTTKAIEAMREAKAEIEKLRAVIQAIQDDHYVKMFEKRVRGPTHPDLDYPRDAEGRLVGHIPDDVPER